MTMPDVRTILSRAFFERPAEIVGPDLIGCYIFTTVDGCRAGGMIIETEAYDMNDPAAHCHPNANPGRRRRSDAMLLSGGHAYVHNDRGMACLNLTCDREGFGSAVLVRSLWPTEGIDTMAIRRSAHPSADKRVKQREANYRRFLCNGPSKIGEALAITSDLNNACLLQSPFEMKLKDTPPTLLNGPRINIKKGRETPWRWGHGDLARYLSKQFKG